MKPVILLKNLPTGRGKTVLCAGIRVKLPDAEAAKLIMAGIAEACDGSKCYKRPKSEPKKKPKAPKLDVDAG